MQFCYSQKQNIATTHNYYFSAVGNDNNQGNINHPFQTINRLNNLHLRPGDAIYFKGGDTFSGSIYIDSTENGSIHHNIFISSYGKNKAIINSGNETALLLHKVKYIKIRNLIFIGSGRKNGNTKDGIRIDSSSNISVNDVKVSGFQKTGLMIYSSSNIIATNVHAYEN